ncbi:MAG: hypothetical protein IPM27_12230 [Nitrosomonadales bacterium]|nr:hypothetical protein [Nitrosomonadales bacterium]
MSRRRDVVAALTDSQNPRTIGISSCGAKISGMELSTICRRFKLESPDGKLRETVCSHTEGLFHHPIQQEKCISIKPPLDSRLRGNDAVFFTRLHF